jgi:phosphatidate cytidylyltransferase
MSLQLDRSLFLRVASAVILMPLVLFALVHSVTSFLIMIGIVFIICCYEWVIMARRLPRPAVHIILGLIYLFVGFYAMAELYVMYRGGLGLTLALLLSIWASDTGAYFAGRAIGGPKMAPAISPNKTWAGLIGGLLSSALALFLYGRYIGPWLGDLTGNLDYVALGMVGMFSLLLIGASLTIVGQIGDLLESYFKRKAGVKDSSNLIPGHGGFLDRMDSLLLAAPAFLIVLKLLGIL